MIDCRPAGLSEGGNSLQFIPSVSAELVAARQSGLTKAWSAGYMEPVRSHLVRAEVKAATARAIASGEVKAINAEVYSFTPTAPVRVSQAGR